MATQLVIERQQASVAPATPPITSSKFSSTASVDETSFSSMSKPPSATAEETPFSKSQLALVDEEIFSPRPPPPPKQCGLTVLVS